MRKVFSWGLRCLGILFLMHSAPPACRAAPVVIDPFSFSSAGEAAKVWRAVAPAPRVELGAQGGLVLPCPFSGDTDRVYWDRDVKLNLSQATSFELELVCEQPDALRSLAIYFRSGNGWYIWNKPLREAGRQRVRLGRDQFSTEGTPAGWDRIDRIRISPWKGVPKDTRVTLLRFSYQQDALFILAASLSTADPGERAMSQRIGERVGRWLSDQGISHTVMKEDEALRRGLDNARLVVLPLNPNPPPQLLAELQRVLERGGKLVVCFSASEALARLMRVELGPYTPAGDPGRWEAMVFRNHRDLHVPERVYQSSWNIRPVRPLDETGRIIATWANAAGKLTSDPAWVQTTRGLWMTHILLEDDSFAKRHMMTGLLGACDRTVLYEAARHALAAAGKVDHFPGLEESLAGISRLGKGHPAGAEINRLLDEARGLKSTMLQQFNLAGYANVIDTARVLQDRMTEAYSLCQVNRPGEFRGIWDHDGTGWFVGDWDKTCRIMKESGFTAVLPNMQWAGLTHYPSRVYPVSATSRLYGDQMQACLKAARKHGLQVHVWKVCWNIEQAPDDFKARMKREGRLLKQQGGGTMNWLDPAQPANIELELNALKELVRTYAIDGLHLDYIRYHPNAAKKDGKATVISEFVRRVHEEVAPLRPGMKVSAAVWGAYPSCVNSIGQDWALWLKAGWVDFLCPMNYTVDRHEFTGLLQKQLALPNARGRIYPGLGVTAAESQLRPDAVIEQVLSLRELGAPGFVLFDMSHPVLDGTLPKSPS
jgi:uncharacterized lipoprotein YddW (UPF0748 family)